MQKIKYLNWSGIINIIKCSLIGIVSTLLGAVIFAFVLKFANLSTTFIAYINDIIKIFSIFIIVTCLKKSNKEKVFIKSLVAGVVYALLSFVVFSILNGSFVVNMSFLYDLIFAVVVSAIVSVIINLLTKKSV